MAGSYTLVGDPARWVPFRSRAGTACAVDRNLACPRSQGDRTHGLTGQLDTLASFGPTGIGRSNLHELTRSSELDAVKVGTATLVTATSLKRLDELHQV